MNRIEALEILRSDISDDRLRAARFLVRGAFKEDFDALIAALGKETNKWVRTSLRRGLERLRTGFIDADESAEVETIEERYIYANAVRDTTQVLLHEIRPIVGRLGVYANREITNYDISETRTEWELLQRMLDAIEALGEATAVPQYEPFDLAALITQIVQSETQRSSVKMEQAGPTPLIINGAKIQLHLVLSNALRNAVEANDRVEWVEPIIINWGETDREYWICVLDRGCGLPGRGNDIFKPKVSTKPKHSGMGLVIVNRAAQSFNGEVKLDSRNGGGARFEVRWPKR